MSDYEPDFIERNGTWLLSAFGLLGAGGSAILWYMLRSRCTVIKCCGGECRREVVALPPQAFDQNNSRV